MSHYRSAMMLGRLTSGLQSDHGSRVHAVTAAGVSLCGRRPGKRSVGWSTSDGHMVVDCPRCLLKIDHCPECKNTGELENGDFCQDCCEHGEFEHGECGYCGKDCMDDLVCAAEYACEGDR